MKTKAAQLGMLLGVALVLSYVESLIPFAFGIPGMKLGLPNAAILIVLYLYGWKEALIINILRIVLSGFMFGSMFGILFSLSGALISFIVMCLVKRLDIFSIKGVSICGGVSHNIGQMLVAVFVVKTSGIMYYLPVLMVGGVITGILIGIISQSIIPRIKNAASL
ncbi:MAG: Gx transporter family protein [Butyrivibrio sp.]|uniref:Gx transporter family protein n=1 Tax=Butyrivibrio sp. TaxID=28121 RepID=UPI0025FFBE5B|nr:Gx transporter family protein [Butyrivibrio sp.]MCR5771034.1 Gx transporter family protein [Butyrivibrio sp.]